MSELKVKVGEAMLITYSGYGKTNRAIRYVQSVDSRFFTDNKGTPWSYDGGTYPKKDREKHGTTAIRHATPADIEEVREQNKRNRLIVLLRDCKWEDLDTCSLEAVQHVVERGKKS